MSNGNTYPLGFGTGRFLTLEIMRISRLRELPCRLAFSQVKHTPLYMYRGELIMPNGVYHACMYVQFKGM